MISTSDLQNASPEKLLTEYVALCNRAIEENREKFWYQQAKQLNELLWKGANFRTIIYGRNPGDVLDERIIHFDPQGQPKLKVLPRGEHKVALTWKAPLAYLQEVLERPERYIENPLLLDWDWMKERAQDEAHYRVDNRSLAAGLVLGSAATLLAVSVFSKKQPRHSLEHR